MCGSGESEAHKPLGGEVPILRFLIGSEGWLSCLGDEDLEMRWLLILQVIVRCGVGLVISPMTVVAN